MNWQASPMFEEENASSSVKETYLSEQRLEQKSHEDEEKDPNLEEDDLEEVFDSKSKSEQQKGFKKIFQNAVKKNNIIHKIQVLREEKDIVKEQELDKASLGAKGFKERFQRSRPNSICDPLDMIPASDVPSSHNLTLPSCSTSTWNPKCLETTNKPWPAEQGQTTPIIANAGKSSNDKMEQESNEERILIHQ